MGKKTWIGIVAVVLLIISFVIFLITTNNSACKPDCTNKICGSNDNCDGICDINIGCITPLNKFKNNSIWVFIRKDPDLSGSFLLESKPTDDNEFILKYCHTSNERELVIDDGVWVIKNKGTKVIEWILDGLDSSDTYFKFISNDASLDQTVYLYITPMVLPPKPQYP